ncbi:unnamed protein product [Rotaria socialis]|uniref:Rab-GAP TBC domain-containing protein n=1 Tax=Rotaria socialis TaxID=392032 RepID=A0A818BNQ8_9BILA|nr:unnamed protein product [Rotaria socialis]CAF3746494.1 unnamed protein product [Rotaria socialis]
MDNSTSLSSLNSIDFILIGKEPPHLKIAAGGGSADLENNMAEILNESPVQTTSNDTNFIPESIPISNNGENLAKTPIKNDIGLTKMHRPDLTNSILFHRVTYLGSASVNAPRSEDELNRNMAILNEQSKMSIEVTLCVPDNSNGVVRLLDPQTELEITCYRISQILFCARGPTNTPLAHCWAFTTSRITTLTNVQSQSNGNNSETGQTQHELLYQCQVFRCDNQEAIYKILTSFANAFQRTTPSTTSQTSVKVNQQFALISRRTTSLIGQAIQATVAQLQPQSSNTSQSSSSSNNQQQILQKPTDGPIKFRSYFDIKEETVDSKGNISFTSVPRPEKNVFRLRKDVRKNVTVALQHIRGFPLNIERCFGMLLAQGRNVRACDMQLLDLESMGKSEDNRYYMVHGNWDPSARGFNELIHLNEETPKGARVFLTIALDLVISGIPEPVRFLIEAKARVCLLNSKGDILSQDISDTIWSPFKKLSPFTEEFDMILKEATSKSSSSSRQDDTYEVVLLESNSEAERRAKLRQSAAVATTAAEEDDDEPMVSGFGHVSKECDEEVLGNWSDILSKWRKNYAERPRGLQALVRRGIPEALRGEVWQLLAGSVGEENEMINTYRLLLTKESASERVIVNDLNRTFPAHEYFKEEGGIGQEALYKLSRAYSVRDEEVGYCQGLSFVIASLLIHMPEEQAFMLLCKLMEDPKYLLREMYKANFENLQVRFHQLTCLIQDNLPDLYGHFDDLKVECHMYASQWFLTLFTAKFPLYLVFRVMDIFLYDGFNALFGVALALLKFSQKDLLSLDFEGIMRFFRVNLPKKYRCEDHADELIQTACSMKINVKKLKRYEKDYFMRRAEEEQGELPLQRLEADNKRLTETCMRSELENEMLALELVNDRVRLKSNLDQADERIEKLTRELQATRSIVKESEQHTFRLNEELENIRDAFRRTCDELQQTQKIVTEYKQICSQLNDQLDKQKEKYNNKIEAIQNLCCDSCKTSMRAKMSPLTSIASTPEREGMNDDYNDDILPTLSSMSSSITDRLHQVEIELAEKKLALTEALCKNQELAHQLRHSTSAASDSDTNSVNSVRSINSNNNNNSTIIMLTYPFDFHFTSAIVSRVPASLKDAAICQREIREVINIEKARRQHQDYIAVLRKLGLDVIELPADESLPEGVFVEDTAVTCDGIALICRPGLPGRIKEVDIIRTILKREGLSIIDIKDPLATIDGGDVLFTGREFFVGLSKTTNLAGAKAVASAFPEYPVTLIRVKKGAHLKNFVSMVGVDTMAIGGSDIAKDLLRQMEEMSEYKFYKIITLRDDATANCLWINGSILHLPADHRYEESIRTLINRLGSTLSHSELLNNEFAKIDCVLSNRCLLFNRSKEHHNSDR